MGERTCTVDGCANKLSCRGMCNKHYLRWRNSGSTGLRVAVVKTCVCIDCGVRFDRDPDKLGGSPPKRCPEHRATARRGYKDAWAARNPPDPEERRAAGRERYAANRGKLSAQRAAWARAKVRARPDYQPTYVCRLCGDERERKSLLGNAPTVCPSCDPVVMAERRGRWVQANPDLDAASKAASGHRRRARMYGADAEDIDRRHVFKRDGWACGICSDAIDPALSHPNPWSVSLDHVIPLGRGGSHTYDNVQAAHLRCNVRKNVKMPQARPA